MVNGVLPSRSTCAAELGWVRDVLDQLGLELQRRMQAQGESWPPAGKAAARARAGRAASPSLHSAAMHCDTSLMESCI